MRLAPSRSRLLHGGLLVALALGIALGAAAQEEEEGDGGIRGWSPFFEPGLALHMQDFEAKGASTIGIRSRKATVLSVLTTRLAGGVRGPRWEQLAGDPHLLVRAGVAFPARTASTLESETQTFGMLPDQDQRSSKFKVEWGTQWWAALGLQFRLPLDWLELRATPSVSYLGSRQRYGGAFSVRTPPIPSDPPTPSMLFRIKGNASSTQHFLGPRLELECAFARFRRLQLSLYLDGTAFVLLGDRSESMTFAGDVDGSLETGEVRFETERVAGQVGFGLRGAFW